MDCEGVCCEIGNCAVKFDSGIALYIYGDVITTMLVLSLVFLLCTEWARGGSSMMSII